MIRTTACISLLSLCLVSQALAAEPNSEQLQKTTEKSDLSADLELFVRGAIDEGLLTPVKPERSDKDVPAVPKDVVVAPVEEASSPAHMLDQEPQYSACNGAYALDFSEFQRIGRYQEMYEVRDKMASASGESGLPISTAELAKAYIALGLYSEAIMVLKRAPGPEVASYRKLASLMENRQKPDVSFFREMASCQKDRGHWLALGQLIAGQSEGVMNLQGSLSEFRKLPLQLRIDFAALSIPALERMDEKTLASKLMADFSEEEIANSSQLRFVEALIKLDSGDPAAERTLVTFLDHPQFQEQALGAMLRRNRPLDPAFEEILLGDLMRKFGHDGSDKELAASLQFALQELSARSSYKPIMELAAMSSLQNPAAQAEVRRQLISGLERDISSDDPLRNLAAINALAGDTALLDDQSGRDELYKAATDRAVHFGFASLASELSKKSEADGDTVLKIATMAFRRHDYPEVYSVARSHPRDERLNLLAAKSAIKEQDVAKLQQFESKLSLKPDAVLALIEADALSGYWMVSARVYQAASQLTGADHESRYSRVSMLKRAAQNPSVPAAPMTMARASSLLGSSPAAPAPPSRGSN